MNIGVTMSIGCVRMLLLMLSTLIAISLLVCNEARAGETFLMNVDQSRVLHLATPAASILIGNPAIADAIVQDPNTLIISGKFYGTTDILILNQKNEEVARYSVQVTSATDDPSRIVVYKGTKRESVSCTPECSPTLVTGDDSTYKDNIVKGITNQLSLFSSR